MRPDPSSLGEGWAHPGGDGVERFGAFAVDGMRLALPLAALVEVVPFAALASLPCRSPAVLGGLKFRGGVVPVIELQEALGHPGPLGPRACVLLVQQAGRLLGLAVDHALGVFAPKPGRLPQRMGPAQGGEVGWLLGSVEVAGEEAALLLVSLATLFAVPGLPSAALEDVQTGLGVVPPPALSLMVVRSQGVQLAIDALAVQGTMPAPVLVASPLARGHCRGVLHAEGGVMPVVDLLSLVGLGRTSPGAATQAFSLLVGGRLISLLVDEVLEIASVAHADLAPMPPCAGAQAGLFAGVLAARVPRRPGDEAQTCYVLDAAALAGHPELKALAEVSGAVPVGRPASAEPDVLAGTAAEMLVYEVGMPAATPLVQVEEILAPMAAGTRLAGQAPMLGLVVHRGHGIPVFCLVSLLGGQGAAPPEQACVLVVLRADGQRIGFAVPRLSCIERASWKTFLGRAVNQAGTLARAAQSGELALFEGTGSQPERMVSVVDLQALAGALGPHEAQRQEELVA